MGRIFITADLHGSFKPIRDFYIYMNSSFDRTMPLTNEDVIIVLGDFGANFFFNERDDRYKAKLKNYKANFFVIRGNHEERPSICSAKNPYNWKKETFFDNEVWVEKQYPYIKYAMDYPSIYNINGHKTLVLPGAYSVDKFYRLSNNWSWFEQEQLTTKEKEKGKELIRKYKDCEVVLSHTCPIIYEPTDLFLSQVDQNLVDKSMERYLGEIEYKLNYKLWLWGHYHALRIYPKYEDKQMIMLYNDSFLEFDKYFENIDEPMNSIIKVRAAV